MKFTNVRKDFPELAEALEEDTSTVGLFWAKGWTPPNRIFFISGSGLVVGACFASSLCAGVVALGVVLIIVALFKL